MGEAPRVVSIGLPVYNGERFLRSTLESLLAQTVKDFELIVSDNASTDGTEAIGREYAACDPRVIYHRQPVNLGLAGNYDFLVRHARGHYFKWATADDRCEAHFVERCVAVLDAEPDVVLAYPAARFIDSEDHPLDDHWDPGFPLDSSSAAERLRYVVRAQHWVNAILGVIRRDELLGALPYPRYPGGDYVLLGRLCLRGRFAEIAEPLLLRRIHPEASSQQTEDPERLSKYLAGSARISLPAWCRLRDHSRTVLSAELALGEKLVLLFELARQAVSIHDRLAREVVSAVRAMRVPRQLP